MFDLGTQPTLPQNLVKVVSSACAQTGKHLLLKQNVSEKNQRHFLFLENKKNVSATDVSFAHKWENIKGNMFPGQCFFNNVSSFVEALKP